MKLFKLSDKGNVAYILAETGENAIKKWRYRGLHRGLQSWPQNMEIVASQFGSLPEYFES